MFPPEDDEDISENILDAQVLVFLFFFSMMKTMKQYSQV
jgi:hypothetical protein